MHLLLIRHAVAEDREAFAATGEDDARRPLTARGRRRMRRAARGLARQLRTPDVIVSSELVRASETATIVAHAFHAAPPIQRSAALDPAAPTTELVQWLQSLGDVELVAAVGHEPHLGRLVSWLLTGHAQPWVELRKGGACLLAFEGVPAAGGARLEWVLTAWQLRKLR